MGDNGNTLGGCLTRYVKLRVAYAPGMSGTFTSHRLQMKPLVSDPNMHPGTCMTHVPRCMSGSLTHGGRENVSGILGACPTRNFTYLPKAHGMADDVLVIPHVARPIAKVVFNVQDTRAIVFYEEGFQLSEPFQSQSILEIAKTLLYLRKYIICAIGSLAISNYINGATYPVIRIECSIGSIPLPLSYCCNWQGYGQEFHIME